MEDCLNSIDSDIDLREFLSKLKVGAGRRCEV